MGSDDFDMFFFQQTKHRNIPKRFKKLPEELPESLKFAHLNPKVAAYLASKEKQKQEEAELFGNGLGKKSLMPEISQAFTSARHRLDRSLSNDEDSQRYLLEQAKASAGTVLAQLAKIIYRYENIARHVPKSLEYQFMCSANDLMLDVVVLPREWQTYAMKEAYARMMASAAIEVQSSDGDLTGPAIAEEEGRPARGPWPSQPGAESGQLPRVTKRRVLSRGGHGLPEIVEDSETDVSGEPPRGRRNDSRLSSSSRAAGRSDRLAGRTLHVEKGAGPGSIAGRSSGLRRSMHDYELMSTLTEAPSEFRSSIMAIPSNSASIIQFQLSSKVCEEKGWIVQKGRENELVWEAVLEWCVQILQQAHKLINEQKAQEKDMGYNHSVQVRFYGDTRKETLLKYGKTPVKPVVSPAVRGGKPLIPCIYDQQNEGKQLMLAGHLDGTTVVYYPSGRPAVVVAAAGFHHSGFYTIAYDDDFNMTMLACFTPSGRGVCYYANGNIRFLATRKGGHIAKENGTLERKWKWSPGGVKITTPVGFQLNSCLAFRCVSESQMVLFFSCVRESARFSLGSCQHELLPLHSGDETEQLLTCFTFSSRAARELLHLSVSKAKAYKSKTKKKQEKLNRQLAELVRSIDLQEKNMYDTEADKELARLQRKSRNLVDDWMEHYRIALGLTSPHLSHMPDSPHIRHRRHTQSAKSWDCDKAQRSGALGLEQRDAERILRAPSAPTVSRNPHVESARSSMLSPSRSTASLMVKFDSSLEVNQSGTIDNISGEDSKEQLPISTFSVAKFQEHPLFRSRSVCSAPKLSSRQGTVTSISECEVVPLPNLTLCCSALRQILLSETRPQCRCSRHVIPNISDVEYDRYISKEAPRSQLQIIMVHSSLYPNTIPAESMLNRMYANQNRNRTQPCLLSRGDLFRIFKYDINSAAIDTDHAQPLLLTRHNVVPGMILIYGDNKLLFCDHILNGYGYTLRDFKKQISRSRSDFVHGQSLPSDFRFSPSKGQHGLRSAWGGDIGGTGVDRFGSPGTALDQPLSHIRQSDQLDSSFTSHADPHSAVPTLPPLPLPVLQKASRGVRSTKRESVRISLPASSSHAQFSSVSRATSRRPAASTTAAVAIPDQIAT